jgi:hypothetical protein
MRVHDLTSANERKALGKNAVVPPAAKGAHIPVRAGDAVHKYRRGSAMSTAESLWHGTAREKGD